MEEWQERVIEERRQLLIKINSLRSFIADAGFTNLSKLQRFQLEMQLHFMLGYLHTLNSRIEGFDHG